MIGLGLNLNKIKRKPTYGPELVTNGGFDADSDWTLLTGWSISGGVLNGSGIAAANTAKPTVNIGMVSGKTYKFQFEIKSRTGGSIEFAVFDGAGGGSPDFNTVGTHTWIYTAVREDDQFVIRGRTSFTGTVDNVSVREVL